MMICEPTVNWNDSYQNPCKARQELSCNAAPDSIPAEERALYLDLLLHLAGPCRRQTPPHGAG